MNNATATADYSRYRETSSDQMLMDGHVHIYPHVPLESVFRAIESNLRRQQLSQCVLLLAEPRGVEGFERLLRTGEEGRQRDGLQDWRPQVQTDNEVDMRRGDGLRAVFLRGQQLVTGEGLEVLAAGTRGSVSHGLGLRHTIDEIRSRGGWATLAWGVGKWLGRRGRLVADAVRAEAGSGDVMLGDNGGRPWCWVSVPQFALAVERGMPIVPGSDPLPVGGDEIRIASYGAMLELSADALRQKDLHGAVRQALVGSAIVRRGKRVGAAHALYNQVRMQAMGRAKRRITASDGQGE